MSASHDKCIASGTQMWDPRAMCTVRRELEPPPLTVYKDLGSTGARMKCARLCSRLRLPSNGLETIDCKAEVVELADTPS